MRAETAQEPGQVTSKRGVYAYQIWRLQCLVSRYSRKGHVTAEEFRKQRTYTETYTYTETSTERKRERGTVSKDNSEL